MSHSLKHSAVEAVGSILVGWSVALLVQLINFRVLGLQVTLAQSAALSAIFTAVTLVRVYILRRAFDRWGMG